MELGGHFAEVDFAVGQNGAAALFTFAIAVFPELVTGLGVEAKEGAGFIGDVKAAFVDDRRGVAGDDALFAPDEFGRALDEVAYIRFASVYRNFADLDEMREAMEGVVGLNADGEPQDNKRKGKKANGA